jgi:hypothetical protein
MTICSCRCALGSLPQFGTGQWPRSTKASQAHTLHTLVCAALLCLQARRILEAELADERVARASAEEARARAEAERARASLARDELSAQLRIAQQRADAAEEEQLRAEEEAGSLRAELAAMQPQQQQQQQQQQDSGQLASAAEALAAELAQAQASSVAARAEAAALRQQLAAAQTGNTAAVPAAHSVAGKDAPRSRVSEAGDERFELELLMAKVLALKRSRDKLLAQLDSQSVDLEQLAAENTV